MAQKIRFDAVGIGLNSVDLLCRVDQFPAFNTKGPLQEVTRQGGGQAATAMAALSRLGLRTAFIGAVGDDAEGAFSRESLDEEGVNTEGMVVQPGRASQFAVIIVASGEAVAARGARTIMWRREVMLSPGDVSEGIVRAGRILHLDGHSMEAEIQAARWARESGIPVSLDAERVLPGMEKLVGLTDYLVAAEDFPSLFTGEEEPEAALRRIHALGPRVAAMTRGSAGALAFDGALFYDSPGFEVDAVDTTGAGDAFHAGFLFGVLQDYGLERTLRFANAVAAMNCRRLGGRAGLPDLQEAETFLSERLGLGNS
ncbi:MAG: PfkB family carbohydrate kinase [bacterium]|nr:PfkB family carbohydrate kinase [bacterium]